MRVKGKYATKNTGRGAGSLSALKSKSGIKSQRAGGRTAKRLDEVRHISPSQGDLTKRWQMIRESAKQKGAKLDSDDSFILPNTRVRKGRSKGPISSNASIDTSEMYPLNKLPVRKDKYFAVRPKIST